MSYSFDLMFLDAPLSRAAVPLFESSSKDDLTSQLVKVRLNAYRRAATRNTRMPFSLRQSA